jgi:hypothetical protein
MKRPDIVPAIVKVGRPHVTLRCVANQYADRTCERIVEFGTVGRNDGGGLICIRNHPDGTTSVSVYRTDANVIVITPTTGKST